jgi:SAM-dependent methyltransferase
MTVASPTQGEKIELLSVALLDEYRQQVNALKRLAQSINLEFGWHYLLDLTWILAQLGEACGRQMMDGGAGTGILQWFLAEQGAQVISVDRSSRAELPLRYRTRFRARGLRPEDLTPWREVLKVDFARKMPIRSKLSFLARELVGFSLPERSAGVVILYNQDLKDLVDIPSNSLDAVVAVSALEHNSREDLPVVVTELMRVLKPGGILAATLTAANEQDVWHTPSSGWCYTDASLRQAFNLPHAPSNYAQFDELFAALRNCAELRDNLAKFYFASGNNGMPWGKWDPQYLPVGVVKIK